MHASPFARAVARATGESLAVIARRGFQPLTFGPPEDAGGPFDPEPRDPESKCLDWDAVDRRRNVALVAQRPDRRAA